MRVISGGQNGADFAALKAAKHANLETGGFAPPDFMTVSGKKPELETEFGLAAAGTAGGAAGYVLRSKLNVDAASAVIAIYIKESAGTGKTIEYARTGKWPSAQPPRIENCQLFEELEVSRKPILVVYSYREHHALVVSRIQKFLKDHSPNVVNVCGNRECNEDEVEELLFMAFRPFGKVK